MIFPIEKGDTLKQKLAKILWNASEITHIGLGRYAPKVFEIIMNIKGNVQGEK